jgi:hypothetical protein
MKETKYRNRILEEVEIDDGMQKEAFDSSEYSEYLYDEDDEKVKIIEY